MLKKAIIQLEEEFSISPAQILSLASSFQKHMEQGLKGHVSSLKMFPSYLSAPRGYERGTFLALDFGGSNARAAIVELKGKGNYQEISRLASPLSDPQSGQDYRAATATAEELFDYLAGMIKKVLNNSPINFLNSSTAQQLPLGFTFSFPYRQGRLEEGILLKWDKEVKTSGVVGKDVGKLLCAALERQGLDILRPVAIINDTVANFLTAAYKDPKVDIATILGTGHNTSFLEQKAPGFDAPVIINTESGNFSDAPQTGYDQILNGQSADPGEQKFEKMLSGKYLGELYRQIVLDLFHQGLLGSFTALPAGWKEAYTVSGQDLALILAEKAEVNTLPLHRSEDNRIACRRIANLLTKRSARLAAASLLGIVRHLDPHLHNPHTIAVDGSLYEGMPGYTQEFKVALREGLEDKAGQVSINLSAGGSLTGAAIAAALAKNVYL